MPAALSTKEFKSKIRPGIELLSEYKHRKIKVKYKCLNCNSIKEVLPTSLLLNGVSTKCSSCRRLGIARPTKPHVVFEKEVYNLNRKTVKLLEKYKNARTKIKIKCLICNNISKVLPQSLRELRKSCKYCSPTAISKTLQKSESIIKYNIKEKLGSKYKCIGIDSSNNTRYAEVLCPRNHIYKTRIDVLGSCKICNTYIQKKTHQQFKFDLEEVHGNKIKPLDKYITSRTKIRFQCNKNHIWQTTPDKIINAKSGCPRCLKIPRHSKPALDWLKSLEKKLRIKIQHAENGVEFKPASNLHADGYNKRFNIIFEFYGDYYHGNPKRFEKTDKMQKLYNNTIKREKRIRKLGYNIVTIWEYDYKNNYKYWLDKNIPKILSMKS